MGPYVLVSRIGSGPMGSVFVARQSTIQRTVAVKVFHSHLFKYPNVEAAFLQDFLSKPGVFATDLVLNEQQIRYVQELNVELQAQKAVLPFAQCADMSLAEEALKLIKA